jgi:2'-5' RNA ligase
MAAPLPGLPRSSAGKVPSPRRDLHRSFWNNFSTADTLETNVTMQASSVQGICEAAMSPEIHSIWLMASPADERFLADLVAELSRHFGTPVFAPHLTISGDTQAPIAALETGIAAAASHVQPFSEAIFGVETSEAYFRSFYARFPVSAPLAALKQQLDAEQAGVFMPHISLLYGAVAPEPKAAAAEAMQRMLTGRRIRFDRLCLVSSGQDVPIEHWTVKPTARLGGG